MSRKHNKRYVCDFETSTEEWLKYDDRVRVWAWCLVDIDDISKIQYGNCIESLFYIFDNLEENVTLYYHNLKFDGQYIIWEINHRGFNWVDYDPSKKKKYPPNSYSTVITDVNQWYQIILFYKGHTITIRDSMKLYDMSVDTIAKSLGFEEQKLTLDYERYRPEGYVLEPYEVEYITHDVVIVARALKTLFDAGHTKITISSNALSDYKKRCKDFKTLFPEIKEETDTFVRQSYKGGFTYANPTHTNKHYKKHGVVFDYNSLYPSILYDELMPYGEPVWFDGEYQEDEEYPLYVQMLTCYFDLKEGKIPSLQLKHNPRFLPNEYIKSSNNEAYTLTLTSIDLELFKEQYDVEVVEYKGGYKFKAQHDMYKEYIDYWTEEKIKAKKEGNKTMYLISKNFLNSLYGKTGANPHGGMKRPVLNEHDLISYPAIEDNSRKSIYVPTATFCTSYGRKRIIEACQFIRDWSLEHKGYDAWTYSDTDSIHAFLSKKDVRYLSQYLNIDDYKLGYLKLESEFTEAKYLRQKCYMERLPDGSLNVTIAGLPKRLAPIMTFENFNVGFTTKDLPKEYLDKIGYKMTYKQVKGGVLLVKTDFTIK